MMEFPNPQKHGQVQNFSQEVSLEFTQIVKKHNSTLESKLKKDRPRDFLLRETQHVIDKLSLEMQRRSKRTLERFASISVSGVNHPKLLSILSDVKDYWKDNFRPALASFSCEAVGGKPEAADDISLMITLMGAGLGLHDDIIDKSTNKHFRMTILGSHGTDAALLAGELLIVKALTHIRELGAKAPKHVEINSILEIYEGFFLEVWEGEFMETQCRRNLETGLKNYEEILWKSTADTEACTRLGAIMGGGSKVEVELLAEIGRRIGFTYRLIDDVKDSLNIEGNLPSRLENESIPLPILYAAKYSNENYVKIKSFLDEPVSISAKVRDILKLCFETEAFKYVLKKSRENSRKARQKLDLLKKSEAQKWLELMAANSQSELENLCV